MRLQKYMALCGVASRRRAEEMIAAGQVQVNGVTITEMGTQVEEEDEVRVDGQIIHPEAEKRYVIYHKPAGEVTTVNDPEGRACVLDHFRDYPVRLYPVGRLDYDSEGLLLLTNDGALTERLLHPSHQVDKTYLARVTGSVSLDTVSLILPQTLQAFSGETPVAYARPKAYAAMSEAQKAEHFTIDSRSFFALGEIEAAGDVKYQTVNEAWDDVYLVQQINMRNRGKTGTEFLEVVGR